jgi:5-formyltetrahydrofolate cyclo-ligase
MALPDKAILRAEARTLRRRLADAAPMAAERAALGVADLPSGTLVAVYCAMGSELDPEPMARVLAASGVALCLPVVIERDAAMIFRRWLPGDPLEADKAGCPAPLPLAEGVDPDLILTPLLAFDDFGGRLGQGGGYYDRTFAARPGVLRIGFGFQGQRVERLPMESHDAPLHGVLTEVGYTAARKV